jgi:hypothetical protein
MARGRCHALAETLAAFWIDLRYTDRRSHRCEDTSHQCRQRNSARTPSSTCTGPQQPALTESVRRVSTWPARGWRLLRCGSVCVSPRLAWIAEAAAYSPADRRWLPTRLPKRAKRQLTLRKKSGSLIRQAPHPLQILSDFKKTVEGPGAVEVTAAVRPWKTFCPFGSLALISGSKSDREPIRFRGTRPRRYWPNDPLSMIVITQLTRANTQITRATGEELQWPSLW